MDKPCRNDGSRDTVIGLCFHESCRPLANVESAVCAFSLLCRPDVLVLPVLWCLTVLPCACNRGSLDRLRGLRKDVQWSVVQQVPAVVFLFLTGASLLALVRIAGDDIDSLAVDGCGLWVPSRRSPAWSRHTGGLEARRLTPGENNQNIPLSDHRNAQRPSVSICQSL